jgi:ribosome-associated protein
VKACMEKKAEDITILRLDAASGLTDYFVICSGSNPRQVEAIAEAVDEHLSKNGVEPVNVDGRRSENWVALDYGNFMVHVFSESARKFYDLERLWKTATPLHLADLQKPVAKKAVGKKAGTKSLTPTLSQKKGKDGAPGKPTLSAKGADKGGAPKGHKTGVKRARKGK